LNEDRLLIAVVLTLFAVILALNFLTLATLEKASKPACGGCRWWGLPCWLLDWQSPSGGQYQSGC
jgi:hypothetical protein